MIITNDLEDIIEDTKQSDEKIHPWRICPIGKHFVLITQSYLIHQQISVLVFDGYLEQ